MHPLLFVFLNFLKSFQVPTNIVPKATFGMYAASWETQGLRASSL